MLLKTQTMIWQVAKLLARDMLSVCCKIETNKNSVFELMHTDVCAFSSKRKRLKSKKIELCLIVVMCQVC